MKYVAYYRVSTAKQGQSGLGLSAQQESVKNFVSGKGTVVAEYTDIESGKNDNRPELEKAIARAKQLDAVLVIAKLDRLSRNVAFIFKLRDEKVKFVAADLPDANTLTVGIMAVFAQSEREAISKRTKDALAAKRAKGEKLGNNANLTQEGQQMGPQARREKAINNQANKQAMELARLYKKDGMNLQQIADKLNEQNYKTSTGKAFAPMTIKRLLDRHKQIQEEALASKRFQEKMQAESGYMPASYKEHPDLSPDKIQVILEDGVVYVDKAKTFVLSQF